MAESMYSDLERFLLSCPVPSMKLPALIAPVTDLDYLEREAALGWHKEDGVGELIFFLRLNGVAVITYPPLEDILQTILGRKDL